MSELDQLSINALRFLAVDAVEKAKSGHPGAPLGDAPMAYLLFHKYMRHNPEHSKWTNRDRFVLSNGHASAMLYSALHLSGYKVSIEDLQQFRQWGSKTPGHPEYGETDGVEVTTGPLGQGFAMAVGMAIAEKHLAAIYNKPGFEVVDHYTYGICGDGDLMEGVSHEAASLAGTLALGKLIFLYDDNLISLDGPTELSFTEDVEKRFEAYHWHVQRVADGNDLDAISKAIEAAQAVKDKPSIIAVRTVIGYGSPKAGTNKAHGEALGADAVKATKKNLGWPEDKTFYVPDDALKNWRGIIERGKKEEQAWNDRFAAYKKENPELAAEYERVHSGKLKSGWEKSLPKFAADSKPQATRNAGGAVMNAFAKDVPELFGGAADLTTSTKTILKDGGNFHENPTGRNLFFGVREFGMCAAVNGMAVHGGIIPYGSTFFVFTDYCKPAIRLAALMHAHSIFVFTHDSIALGEDGPTHQPIEHLMALRAVPHLIDFRPADANETVAAWRVALERIRGLVLRAVPAGPAHSRSGQARHLPGSEARRLHRGAGRRFAQTSCSSVPVRSFGRSSKPPGDLKKEGINARVVSMPSWRLFEEQSAEYKNSIFPDHLPKLAVEAGSPLGWWKYVGRHGDVIGMERFGASAPGTKSLEELGFRRANVVRRSKALLERAHKENAGAGGQVV